jgi:hypothetical protein
MALMYGNGVLAHHPRCTGMVGKDRALGYSRILDKYLHARLSKTTKINMIAIRAVGFLSLTFAILRSTQILVYLLWHEMEEYYS